MRVSATLPIISSLALAAQAWEISFYLGSSCTSEDLYKVSYPEGSACNQVPEAAANAQSAIIAMDSPDDGNFEFALYGSDDCTGETLGIVSSSEATCFPDEDNVLRSYIVRSINNSKRQAPLRKRSPASIQHEIDSWVSAGSTALSTRDFEKGLAPAKHYAIHNTTELAVLSPDVTSFHSFISASTFVVTGALSFTSLVTGCIGVGSANPIASYSCGASIAGTAISFMAAVYHTYKGIKDFRATLRNNNIELGLRRPRNKRGIEGTMSMSHEEYMEYMLSLAGLQGEFLGYTQRNPGSDDITTPAYHFTGEDGQQYVYSISAKPNGEIRHSISFHHDAVLEKRQGYQGVTVNGGLDVDACQRSRGNTGDLPTSAKSAYSYYHQDFQCLVSSSELLGGGTNYVQSDIMDKSGYAVLTIGMSPYRGSQAVEVTERDECSNDHFYFSQTCVY